MSNKIKKQSLLGKAPERKKQPQRARQKPSARQQQTATAQVSADANEQSKPKSKALWYSLALVVALLLLFPKPKLLTYEKLGMVTQSIFWPGLFGHGATLMDSTLQPRADLDRNIIYLCQDLKKPDSCHKYRVTQQQGFFAAIKTLIFD